MQVKWTNVGGLQSRSYTCGHCGNPIASNQGYFSQRPGTGGHVGQIYICHHCGRPTYFEGGTQAPGPLPGYDVRDISDISVNALYKEARSAFSANAPTAAILCCRKILMHIAVAKGAGQGLKFIEYVEYLSSNYFIPPDAKGWVNHIREKGNEANHEIVVGTEEDAEELLSFIGVLLKVVFEFPAAIQRKQR